MAFQTNVFRGGAWVTEMVDLQTLLKANNSAKASKKARQLKTPQCGILSQTVIDSQFVNFILPVRLRSSRHNDVAFVRDRSIQIFELQEDSRLVEVVFKDDFDIRIRNAAVIGTFNINDNGGGQEGGLPKSGGSSPSILAENTSQLPPQQLLLVLESGTCVFMYLQRCPDGSVEFWARLFPNPMPKSLYMGFHLAVDPSSRYMALASHQEHLIVCELDSEDRSTQYMEKRAVKSWSLRSIQGVIHKVVFLHPNPEHPNHIILLLIVIRNGKSWMVIYDWEHGETLSRVLEKEKRGYRMPVETHLPLLIIPLTVRSAFVTISPDNYTAVWTGTLHGSPTPEAIALKNPPPTNIHYGKSAPIWTAWLRPLRLPSYLKEKDCIYLAREDGVVLYIDADGDADLVIHEMATFNCNISTTFACVFHQCTDALFVGSDSGPGEVWKVPPRQELPQLSILPAGAPTIDFVTTEEPTSWRQTTSSGGRQPQNQELQVRRPDRIFTASGCGTKGAIAEYRYGIKAEIELEFEYGPGIKHAWLFPSRFDSSSPGYDLLISLPDTTGALHFDEGLEEASDLDPNLVPYELLSTTLALEYTDVLLVQITPESVTLAAHDRRAKFRFNDILQYDTILTVSDASIFNGSIACSVYVGSRYQIAIFKIDVAQLSLVPQQTFEVDGEVNCLAITDEFVVAGVWKDGKPFLAKCVRAPSPLPIQMQDLPALLASSRGSDVQRPDCPDTLEPIASIVYAKDSILLGTRSGEVIILSSLRGDPTIDIQKFGMTTAYITSYHDSRTPNTAPTVLVCCDGRLVVLHPKPSCRPTTDPHSFRALQVFPLDEGNLGAPAEEVNFAVAVDLVSNNPSSRFVHVLIASGPKLLLTKVQQRAGLVHRRISVSGAPTRLMYSPKLRCLITAVNLDGKSTLRFVDPDTGEDLGQPVDKHKNPVDFISGLGRSGDTVYGLEEWKFEKDGSVWEYILVTTRLGRLIVVDTEKMAIREDGRQPIKYWARFTHKEDAPIYSVLGCEGGLVYCAGSTLYWFILDTEAKKLKRLKSFNLASPALSLQMANGKLMALTSRDSLLVINQDDNNPPSLCHADPKPRNATHMIEVAGSQRDEPMGSITLVADRDCGIGGMWVPWQSPGKDCEPVFEVDLAASVRRFRRGRARPPWERPYCQQKYGRLMSSPDDADIMGVSLDGSLRHFTLLDVDTWRLLRYIQNIAQTSTDMCPFTASTIFELSDLEPKMDKGLDMQVDGDLLRRWLGARGLDRMRENPYVVKRFMDLMDSLEGGKYTAKLADDAEKLTSYIALGYDIMEYILKRPL